jgi:ribosomal protein L16/L10AE
MGKGKGAVDRLMLYVKKGQILFEIVYKKKLKDKFVKNLLKQCQFKMPLNTKIFSYKK